VLPLLQLVTKEIVYLTSGLKWRQVIMFLFVCVDAALGNCCIDTLRESD